MVSRKAIGPIPGICRIMEDYARRGVFEGFSQQTIRRDWAAFRMLWHGGRVFELIVDTRKKAVIIPLVLPGIPADIYRDFKAFVESHHGADLPEHRRIEKTKARARTSNRRGSVSLTFAVKDGDYEYALKRLIHLVHETYLIFLLNGMYRDYVAEKLGGDPEWV